jgi:hypothetical protein
VAYLGQLDQQVRLGVQQAAEGHLSYQRHLFDDVEPEWVQVDFKRIRVERCLDFGGPWLAMQLLDRLELPTLFQPRRSMTISCTVRKHKLVTIAKRVGRLLGRYSRAAGLFKTDVIQDADGRVRLFWSPTRQSYGDGAEKVEAWRDWAALSEGCYILRTNITDWSGEDLWRAYMQLTDAEAAFRIHKSDLRIRPIWHQRQDRVEAHILVCFLAYVLWKTLGQLCRQSGLGDEPRRVLDELSRIRLVDVILPTRSGIEIRRRCVSQPSDHQAILLQRLGLHLPSDGFGRLTTGLPVAESKMKRM